MYSNDNNYIGGGLGAYHSHKHASKSGVSSLVMPNPVGQGKPFQGFGQNVGKMAPRPLLPKSDAAPTGLETQIANLWKSNLNSADSYVSSDDIWKFCPNTISDYSSLSSASASPEDHSETFFNVASQLQRQTPPDLKMRQCMELPDYGKLFNDHKDYKTMASAENMVKNSLCCQFILQNQCELGDRCSYAHSIMQLGQPIL